MYMNRGCRRIFLPVRLFIYLKLSSPSGILLTFLALHAIRGYRRQRGLKGNRAPHANSVKLHAVLNYPRKFAKRAQISFVPFGGVAKGNLLPFGIY